MVREGVGVGVGARAGVRARVGVRVRQHRGPRAERSVLAPPLEMRSVRLSMAVLLR